MALPTLDPGIAAMNARMPCFTRRLMFKLDPAAAATAAPGYGWFPWKGQRIDTPRGVTTPWTTDDDTHPIP